MPRTFWLGVFIVATLLILVLGSFLIGSNEERFQPTYEVKAKFHDVAGLAEGAQVRVGGIQEGTVKQLMLPNTPDQDVVVSMKLLTQSRDVVRKDSVASIHSEGLLGDKYVEVSFGSVQAGPAENGQVLQSEPPLDVTDLFKKANDILDSAKGATEDFSGTASNLRTVTSKIRSGEGSIGALVNDKTVYQEVAAGATAFHENMDALKHNFLLRGFFRHRGYEDSAELTRNEIPKLPSEPSLKTFQYDPKSLFANANTAKLKNQKKLNEAGKFLESTAFGYAVVASETGPIGDSDKARELTQARSAVVREYLANNFKLDDSRIKTIGLGKNSGASQDGTLSILIYSTGKSRQ